jgi:hypothetical protein
MTSSFLRFLNHTWQCTTVGRTPLDKWSAHRRDLYLTTHNNHKRQTSMPPVGFEPTISAGEQPQTYVLDRAASGTGNVIIYYYKNGFQTKACRFLKSNNIFCVKVQTYSSHSTGCIFLPKFWWNPRNLNLHGKYKTVVDTGWLPPIHSFLADTMQLAKQWSVFSASRCDILLACGFGFLLG